MKRFLAVQTSNQRQIGYSDRVWKDELKYSLVLIEEFVEINFNRTPLFWD
jgi:hypothetical protein